MTKAQIRTLTRVMLGDPDGLRWGNLVLELLIEGVADEVWRELLRSAPWYVSELVEPTVAAAGYIDTAALTHRFHRVQLVTRHGRHYRPTHPRQILSEGGKVLSAPRNSYMLLGDQLWLFPVEADAAVELRYSYLPARYSSLADDAVVTWPDGYDAVLYLKAAARAMGQLGIEGRENLWDEAETEKQRMLAALAERYSEPPVGILLAGTAVEWGSE